MPEFWNVLVIFLAGIVAGMALHSAWLHTYRKRDQERPS